MRAAVAGETVRGSEARTRCRGNTSGLGFSWTNLKSRKVMRHAFDVTCESETAVTGDFHFGMKWEVQKNIEIFSAC